MGKQWPGFAERLQECIRAAGYKNAAQFADASGIRITYVYKWLGGTTPDRENLEKLARLLGVAPAWLLFGDEVDKAPPRPRVRQVLASLLVMLTTMGMVPNGSEAKQGPTLSPGHVDLRDYVKFRYRRWWHRRGTLRDGCRNFSILTTSCVR